MSQSERDLVRRVVTSVGLVRQAAEDTAREIKAEDEKKASEPQPIPLMPLDELLKQSRNSETK